MLPLFSSALRTTSQHVERQLVQKKLNPLVSSLFQRTLTTESHQPRPSLISYFGTLGGAIEGAIAANEYYESEHPKEKMNFGNAVKLIFYTYAGVYGGAAIGSYLPIAPAAIALYYAKKAIEPSQLLLEKD